MVSIIFKDICDIAVMVAMMASYYFVVIRHSENKWKKVCARIRQHGEGAAFIASGLLWAYVRDEPVVLKAPDVSHEGATASGIAMVFIAAKPYGIKTDEITLIAPDAVAEYLEIDSEGHLTESSAAAKA